MSEQWIDVCPATDCPPGDAIERVVGDRIVALVNVDGEIYALDGICAHQGGPLGKGELAGCKLTCPWHGWQYDAKTGQQLTSGSIQQRTFRVRVDGDTIQVMLFD